MNNYHLENEEGCYPQLLTNYITDTFFIMHTNQLTLVDVGCGVGSYLYWFGKKGFKTIGVDNVKLVSSCIVCDLENEKIPLDDNSVDFVFCKSTIEHIKNTHNILSNIYRILKNGGVFICMTPNWKNKEFYDDYTHCHPFSRKSLYEALTIYNFQNVLCDEFYQLPFIWKYPYLKFILHIISLLPERWKWKHGNEITGQPRNLIRFSKEVMLLAKGEKHE